MLSLVLTGRALRRCAAVPWDWARGPIYDPFQGDPPSERGGVKANGHRRTRFVRRAFSCSVRRVSWARPAPCRPPSPPPILWPGGPASTCFVVGSPLQTSECGPPPNTTQHSQNGGSLQNPLCVTKRDARPQTMPFWVALFICVLAALVGGGGGLLAIQTSWGPLDGRCCCVGTSGCPLPCLEGLQASTVSSCVPAGVCCHLRVGGLATSCHSVSATPPHAAPRPIRSRGGGGGIPPPPPTVYGRSDTPLPPSPRREGCIREEEGVWGGGGSGA